MHPREFLQLLLATFQHSPELQRALPIGLIRMYAEKMNRLLVRIPAHAPGQRDQFRVLRRTVLSYLAHMSCAIEQQVAAQTDSSIASHLIDCIRGFVEGTGRLVARPEDSRVQKYRPGIEAPIQQNRPRRAARLLCRLYGLSPFPFF